MNETIVVPLWLYYLLWVLSILFLLGRFARPLVRRLYHNRVITAQKRLDERLDYGLANSTFFKRDTWIDRLLDDVEVQKAIKRSNDNNKQLSHFESCKNARAIAEEIIPSFNALLYLRVGYWFTRNILRLLYWIQVGYPNNKDSSKSYNKIKRDSSVIIVSNHRSNIDPFLLVYMAFRQSAISFSAGEWAKGWPIQQLIHSIGFYIIRRNNTDPLYRCILKRYVHMAVSECVPQGLFLEGALSKDGAMQPVHLGLLNYQIKAMNDGKCKEIVFVPAAINYDRFPEDVSIFEQITNHRKEFKNRNSFFSRFVLLGFLLRLITYIFPRKYKPFGYAAVNFGEPLLLSEWQKNQSGNLKNLGEIERRKLVACLGKTLTERINSIMPITPMAIIATVILKKPSGRLVSSDIISSAYDLIDDLSSLESNILIEKNDISFSLEQAIYILRKQKIISRGKNNDYYLEQSKQKLLEYYANSISHLVNK